ncbi:hypothetical protein Tco_0917104 [Tanacetum coccineum]
MPGSWFPRVNVKYCSMCSNINISELAFEVCPRIPISRKPDVKIGFFDLWKLSSPLDAVVDGLMSNKQNEGSIYNIPTCYGVTLVNGYAIIMLLLASFLKA